MMGFNMHVKRDFQKVLIQMLHKTYIQKFLNEIKKPIMSDIHE